MNLKSSIIGSLRLLHYILRLFRMEDLKNPFKDLTQKRERPLTILANGPSLKGFLASVDADPAIAAATDFCVVNDFVHDPRFELLRPCFCVMSDPLFFIDTIYSARGHEAMEAYAAKTSWPMTLIIPRRYSDSSFLDPVKKNPNISIIAFHNVNYSGPERLRGAFYRRGLGNGEFGTVAINALYAGIMAGYKTIYFHGIDHNFFDNLAVNDQNQLCYRDTHFYGTDPQLRPMMNHYGGASEEARVFRVSEFLDEKARLFHGHEIMNRFARQMGCRVVNLTPNSMVDEYDRSL